MRLVRCLRMKMVVDLDNFKREKKLNDKESGKTY